MVRHRTFRVRVFVGRVRRAVVVRMRARVAVSVVNGMGMLRCVRVASSSRNENPRGARVDVRRSLIPMLDEPMQNGIRPDRASKRKAKR